MTVNRVDITYTKLGFGGLFDQAIEKLTNSEDGTVTFADERFQELIDSANERIERIDERLEVKRERLERQICRDGDGTCPVAGSAGPPGDDQPEPDACPTPDRLMHQCAQKVRFGVAKPAGNTFAGQEGLPVEPMIHPDDHS